MEPKHKRSSFGLYEMALLKENPYTHEVRARQISFTAEFKRIFWVRYQAGEYIPGMPTFPEGGGTRIRWPGFCKTSDILETASIRPFLRLTHSRGENRLPAGS